MQDSKLPNGAGDTFTILAGTGFFVSGPLTEGNIVVQCSEGAAGSVVSTLVATRQRAKWFHACNVSLPGSIRGDVSLHFPNKCTGASARLEYTAQGLQASFYHLALFMASSRRR